MALFVSVLYISGIRQCVPFHVWLLSYFGGLGSFTSYRGLCVLIAEYSLFGTRAQYLMCLSVGEHLGCFHWGLFCAACEHPCAVSVNVGTRARAPAGTHPAVRPCRILGMCVVSRRHKYCLMSKGAVPGASVLILEFVIKKIVVYFF